MSIRESRNAIALNSRINVKFNLIFKLIQRHSCNIWCKRTVFKITSRLENFILVYAKLEMHCDNMYEA